MSASAPPRTRLSPDGRSATTTQRRPPLTQAWSRVARRSLARCAQLMAFHDEHATRPVPSSLQHCCLLAVPLPSSMRRRADAARHGARACSSRCPRPAFNAARHRHPNPCSSPRPSPFLRAEAPSPFTLRFSCPRTKPQPTLRPGTPPPSPWPPPSPEPPAELSLSALLHPSKPPS